MTSATSRLRVGVAGAWDRTEFGAARRWLANQACVSELAHEPVASAPDPDLLLVAQARPGEMTERKLRHLRAIYPLTPVMLIYGSWCEGELRTGRAAVSSVHRVPWYNFRPTMGWIRDVGPPGGLTWLHHPQSWYDDELPGRAPWPTLTNLRVRVQSNSCTQRQQWTQLVQTLGATVVDHSDDSNVQLWDDGPGSRSGLPSVLAHFGGQERISPSLAIVTFPRIDVVSRLESMGPIRVVGKPCAPGLVAWCLRDLARAGSSP